MWNIGYALVLAGIVAGPGCSKEPGPPEMPPMTSIPMFGGRNIGPEGGGVSVGPVTVVLPPGALSHRVRISVEPVTPGQPADPGERNGPVVPLLPPVTTPSSVQPADLVLSRPVQVIFATDANVATVALARLSPQPDRTLAWEPLSGQGRSPGLLWAKSDHLGIFGLVQVNCCSGTTMDNGCTISCDVGPLHYVCDGPAGDASCCDPFGSSPQGEPVQLCGVPAPDLGM
jgi:hypothetical protein